MHVRKLAEAVRKQRGRKMLFVLVRMLQASEIINLPTRLRKPRGSCAEATLALETVCEHRV